MTEEKINVELTQEQFNHVRTILAQSKPSKTRLSREEKGFILQLLDHESDALCSYDDDDDKDEHYYDRQRLVDSIMKKLKV
jgi:hypothetical protein